MIFRKITLNNLGPFREQHSINVSVEDKNKPLVLIGGLNGAGKTTLLTAVQLALYGRLCEEAHSFRSYNAFLNEIANDTARDKLENFGVVLHIHFDGFPINGVLRVSREWTITKKGFKEKFEVSSEDVDDPRIIKDIEDNWLEIMQRILSPELSDLFFFDGEKIIKLADEKTSAELFKESISTLLGLDLVAQLNLDIKSITSDIGISQNTELSKELIEKEEISSELSSAISKLSKEKEKLESKIEKNKLNILRIQEEYKLQSGKGFDIHQLKKDEAGLATSTIEITRNTLLQEMAGDLPLAMVENRFVDILKNVEIDNLRKKSRSSLEVFQERDRKITEWLKNRSFHDASTELAQEMSKWNKDLEDLANMEVIISDKDEDFQKLSDYLSNKMPATLDKTRKLKDDLRTFENKLDKLKSEINQLPDEKEIRDIQIKLSNFEAKDITLNKELSVLEKELASKQHSLNKNSASIDLTKKSILESKVAEGDDVRILKHLLNAQPVLEKFQIALTKKNVKKLEEEIAKSFKSLLRKKALFEYCEIDSENMTLSLYGAEKKLINSNRLSAGERQILAVSILWAISKSVEHPLPIIIDTPLARLDSEHRGSLIFDYFPKASDQVILLSTDQEITSEHSKELENLTSHQFMVEANEKQGTSNFRNGYF